MDYLVHHGIKGQRWGVRRYQNADGSLTEEGKKRYTDGHGRLNKEGKKLMADYERKHTYTEKDANRDKNIYGTVGQKRIQKLMSEKHYSRTAARGRVFVEKFAIGFGTVAASAVAAYGITKAVNNREGSNPKLGVNQARIGTSVRAGEKFKTKVVNNPWDRVVNYKSSFDRKAYNRSRKATRNRTNAYKSMNPDWFQQKTNKAIWVPAVR